MTDLDQTVYSSQPLPPEGSLFESFSDRVLRRVDDVVAGRNCEWQPSAQQRQLLTLLRPHQGKRRAVPLDTVAERMKISRRAVRGLVQDLRTSFGVQLGASRDHDGGGYYLIATEEESRESCSLMLAQAISELRVYHRMLRGSQTIAQTLQQIELGLKEVA
jgi:biotin operon repressor